MAVSKTRLFNKKQTRTAELAKALGHPARIAIVEMLVRQKTCICGDITNELPLAQSTVSQHLKALKKSGIIKGKVEGVKTCYCLNPDIATEAKVLFSQLLQKFEHTTQEEYC